MHNYLCFSRSEIVCQKYSYQNIFDYKRLKRAQQYGNQNLGVLKKNNNTTESNENFINSFQKCKKTNVQDIPYHYLYHYKLLLYCTRSAHFFTVAIYRNNCEIFFVFKKVDFRLFCEICHKNGKEGKISVIKVCRKTGKTIKNKYVKICSYIRDSFYSYLMICQDIVLNIDT